MVRPVVSTRPVAFAAVTVLALMLAACGTSSGSDASPGGSGSGDGATTTTTPKGQMFADDFVDVCQGASQSRAAAYSETGPHKMVYIQTYEDHLQDDSQVLPDDWTVQFDAAKDVYASVDVVGCGVRTEERFLKECTGYQVDGKDTGHKVKLYGATYEVSVHQAKTGKELASKTFETTDTECPSFQSFDEGEKVATVYQSLSEDQLVAFLKPYVQP